LSQELQKSADDDNFWTTMIWMKRKYSTNLTFDIIDIIELANNLKRAMDESLH